jgi:D-hexose-6-phosphate mutarotase
MDTRIFHDFASGSAANGGKPVIIRQFTHQESSFDEMRAKGFHPTSEWMLSPTQADECAKFLDERLKVNEKITLE